MHYALCDDGQIFFLSSMLLLLCPMDTAHAIHCIWNRKETIFWTKTHNVLYHGGTMYCTTVVQCAEIFWEVQCYQCCRSGRDECRQWPITVTFKGPSKPLFFLLFIGLKLKTALRTSKAILIYSSLCELALLGCNAPKEVSSAVMYVFFITIFGKKNWLS